MKLSMILPAVLLCYACCNLWYTVTFGAIYISTSKSVIEEGDTFEINCTVKPLTNVVQFFLDGTPQGDCTSPIPGIAPGTCSTGITQDIITEETTLTISSASIFTQQGNWKCTHNAEEDDDNIYVFNFITVLTNNQYELPATIETSSSPNSEFKVFVACGYPQPTIAWTLDTCDGSETGIAVNSPTLTTNTSAGCTSPLVAYTSAIKASALASPTVETCYIPKATMMYTEKPSVMSSSPFTSQVQFPGPTTQTSMEYVVGGIATTNFIVELSRSTLINTEEVTSTSTSDVIVSLESPYDTNTVNTVILAYHTTDNFGMQTLDQSVKTISAGQSVLATSVWNTSKSSRTDLYFHESLGLLLTSSESSISLYDSYLSQSLHQTNFLSVKTQSDKVSFESITTQSNIIFTNIDVVSITLEITYSSKYTLKSSGDISPLTVYPSSGLLRTDLFFQNSEVSLSESKFEITNPVRLNTFSTNLDTEFIDEITTTITTTTTTTNSYFLIDFSFSNTLLNDSSMQHHTNRPLVTTLDNFIPSISSTGVVMQKEPEDSESYFSNYSSILSTYSSYQYFSNTFERSINTNKNPSFSLESTKPITITESFHTITNLRDDEISTGELKTSFNITTLLSDYLIMAFQSNSHLSPTEGSEYFVTTIQTDTKSSAHEMEVYHTKTSSILRYSILHTSETHTFIHTLQSVVSSHVKGNSDMQSYWHDESPSLELVSSSFKPSSQPTEKLHSSDTSHYISRKTPTVSKDIFTRITKNDGHLSTTTNLPISAIQTGIPAEQTIESSKMKIEFVTQTTGTLSQTENIEPSTSSVTYATSETLFRDSSLFYRSSSDFFIFTSEKFAPTLSPASDISSTSAYLTSTASQNVISEHTKDIIVISTATSIFFFSVFILLISLIAKKHLQKPKRTTDIKADQIGWTNDIRSNSETDKKEFFDSLYTGNSSIFPRLNTKWYSYTHPYEQNWDNL